MVLFVNDVHDDGYVSVVVAIVAEDVNDFSYRLNFHVNYYDDQ